METADPPPKSDDDGDDNASNNNSNINNNTSDVVNQNIDNMEDFDDNNDFYLDYFADLPIDILNRDSILQECCQSSEISDEICQISGLNTNNNAKGAEKRGGGGEKEGRGGVGNEVEEDPELMPRVITLTAYGERGVSDPIVVDMDNKDDFDVSTESYSIHLGTH